MKRTNYYISTLQIQRMKRVSEISGYSVSEIVRRAIDEYIEGRYPDVSHDTDKHSERI